MPLPPVRTITVELTRRCHRRCGFCYVQGRTAPEQGGSDELPAEVLCQAIGSLVRATGCTRLQLSGGEPLLRSDLLPILDSLATTGASISIISEATQLDPELARALAARRIGPMQPTLLSGDASLHDRMRGSGAFAATTKAIATAARAGIPVVVSMVITKLNFNQADRVAELAFALGARSLALSRFCPAGAAAAAYRTLMPEAGQVRHAAESAAAMCRSLRFPVAAAVTIPPCVWSDPAKPPVRTGVCSLLGPRTTVTIAPDGAVRSCALSTEPVGNLLTEPWELLAQRLWHEQLAPMRQAIAPGCRACAWFSKCLGGCRLSARAVFGRPDAPDPLIPPR